MNFFKLKDRILNKVACLPVAILLMLSLFTFSMNPISDFASTDSAVFAYIGEGMRLGRLPYRDMFDHKGPLLYFLNYIGSILNIGYQGVWVVESFLFLLSMLLMIRSIIKIFGWLSVSLTFPVVLYLFFALSAGGNLTETYSVYFTLFFMAFFLQDVINYKLRNKTCFFAGFAMGAVLLLRPNMLGFCFPFMAYMIVYIIRTRNVKFLLVKAFCTTFGILVMVFPFLVWLHYNDIFCDMWKCYIDFNFTYANALPCKIDKWIFLPIGAFILNVSSCAFASRRIKHLMFYNLLYLISATLFVVLKLRYAHYFLPILPAIIIPMTWFFFVGIRSYFRRLFYLLAAFFVIMFVIYQFIGTILDLGNIKKVVFENQRLTKNDILRKKEFKEVLDFKRFIPDSSSVLVIGNACDIYYRLDLRSRNKYFYQSVANFSDDIRCIVDESVKICRDDFIIVSKYYEHPWENSVKENYKVVSETKNYMLYMAKNFIAKTNAN